jgi:hypothetical protein
MNCPYGLWHEHVYLLPALCLQFCVRLIQESRGLHETDSCLLAVHIVTTSESDQGVYSENLTVVKALAGCGDIVVAAYDSPVLKANHLAEAVGPSACVHLIVKVVCL